MTTPKEIRWMKKNITVLDIGDQRILSKVQKTRIILSPQSSFFIPQFSYPCGRLQRPNPSGLFRRGLRVRLWCANCFRGFYPRLHLALGASCQVVKYVGQQLRESECKGCFKAESHFHCMDSGGRAFRNKHDFDCSNNRTHSSRSEIQSDLNLAQKNSK